MNTDGGQQNFSIRLLNEQLRRDAQNSINQFNRIGTAATNAGTTVDRSMGSMSKSVTGAIRSMTNGVTTAMQEMAKNMLGITALLSSGAFLKSLFDESTAFTRQMKIVSTISDEVTNDLQGYKTQVLDLCREISVAPETAAAALYQINSASWLGADGMKVLEVSAKAAVGGVTETAVAADAITTIMNAYHLSAADADAVSDKLFTTVRLGKTTMDELGRSIAYVAPLAATYKISIDEILAAVAQLTKQGNSTQNAMTQISASITAVANELGDTAFENGLLSALEEIEKRSNGSNLALKAQLSNIRAVRGALGLTKENAAETAKMMDEIKNSAGAAETAFKKLNDSAGAETRKLRTNFLKELEGIGGGMNKTLAGLATHLNAAFESGSMQTMLSVLKDLIITYGIYKAIIISAAALEKANNSIRKQSIIITRAAAIQQKSLNWAEMRGVIVTTNLKRAVQALNVALKANSFGLMVAAVAAASYGIYKLITYESAYEKTQKKVNEAVSSAYVELGKEMNALDDLADRLKYAKKGTEEWLKAKNDAVARFGQYDSTLSAEIDRVGNLTTSYDALTAAINKSMAAKALQKYDESASPYEDVDKTLADVQKAIDKGVFYKKDGSKVTVGGPLKAQMRRAVAQYVTSGGKYRLPAKISEYLAYTNTDNDQRSGSYDNIYSKLIHRAMVVNQYKEGREKVAERYGLTLDDITPKVSSDTATLDNNSGNVDVKTVEQQMQELIDQARSESDADKLNQLKEKMKEMLDGGQIDINSQDYKDLSAAYKALKKRFPGSDGGSSSDTPEQRRAAATAAHQAELDLIDSQTRERIRAAQDAEFQVEQAQIDAMENSADKILKQRDLDYRRQQAELQREMEDAILEEIARQKALFDAQEETADAEAKRNGNKNYAKRTFNSGGLLATTTIGENGEATQNYTAGQLLAQGTIGNVDTTVINEILSRYEGLFDDMQTTHNNAWRRTTTDAMNEYLAQWGRGMEKRNAIVALATSRMAAAETEGERQSIFAQMEKDLSDFDIEANRKTSAISTLFDDMSEKTVSDMKKIYAQGQKTLTFLTSGEWNSDTGLELGITEETFNTLSKSPEQLERIRKALKQLKQEIDGTESGFKKLADGLKEVFKAGGDTKKFEEGLAKIIEGMQTVMQVGGFLKDTLSQLGEAFGSDTLGDIATGVGVAMDAMDSAMQGAQAGAAFGPWGAAAGAAIGLVSSLGSAIAKLHDAKHEKKIQQLQDQIEVLEQRYDDLGRSVEKAYSKDAKNIIEQQNTLLRQQKQLIQNQIAEEKSKKDSDESRIKEWEQQIRDIDNTIADNKEKAIDAIFGEDVKAAIDRFAEAYESMFDGGTTRARASKDLVKEMIKNMITEAMKADISEPMEKLRQMMLGFWSDEKITDWEKNQLEDYVDNMLEEQEAKWGWADGYFKDSTSQGSSKGGFTTMSQDSADELNGRFTALQMAGEQIKTTTIEINEQLKAVAARSIQTASAVEEIRGLQLIAVDHLETIRKHTANLAEMNDRLGKIEKYTSRI